MSTVDTQIQENEHTYLPSRTKHQFKIQKGNFKNKNPAAITFPRKRIAHLWTKHYTHEHVATRF